MSVFKFILISILIFANQYLFSQTSPHGKINIECFSCHTTESWKILKENSKFNHSNTTFILNGAHANTNCKSCHKDLKFSVTPRECISCHLDDYNSTTFINHRANKFSIQCQICHSEKITSWINSFEHGKTQFRLEGAHIATACNSCHKTNYSTTNIDCFSCHEKEYRETTEPNHEQAGFLINCIDCHRPVTWKPATNFAHDAFFPINLSSKHSPGVWNSCKDCHTNLSSFKNFECVNCHEHNKSDMDRKHDDESGYIYASSACYSCHPNGEGD